MTNHVEPPRYAFEHPAESADTGETRTVNHDEAALIDDVTDHPGAPVVDVVNDEKTAIYKAIVGDTEIAGLPYNVVGADRLVLLATSVLPEFRNQGVATQLIRRVLDDVRAQGKTVTIVCPIVGHFIERNPEYAELIDPEYPGRSAGSHRH